MTPVLKGFLTDKGFDCTVIAQQVYGGHGYIEEWGMSQFTRDARIAMIYEGANGVQALDLVGRKLGQDGGKHVMAFFAMCTSSATPASASCGPAWPWPPKKRWQMAPMIRISTKRIESGADPVMSLSAEAF